MMSEDKDDSAQDGDRPPEQKKDLPAQEVSINFKDAKLYSPQFGGADTSPRPIPVTVRKKAAAVAEAVSGYFPPDCFADGLHRLDDYSVAILEGKRGIGKGASALALMSRSAHVDVIPLQPAITLAELCAVDYERGTGYVVVGHTAQGGAADAEYHWSTLQELVRQAGAILVVTTTGTVNNAYRVVWQRPDMRGLLGKMLGVLRDGDAVAAKLAERVPDDWAVSDLVECAQRIVKAPDRIEDALEVFDLATISEVRAWFEAQPSPRDVVEVTTLAFNHGVPERRFEALADALESRVMARRSPGKPGGEPRATAVAGVLPQRRRHRRTPAGLVRIEEVLADGIPRRVAVFKSARHRPHVLSELYDTYESTFWSDVKEWLHLLISGRSVAGDEVLPIAEGIARLAILDFEEALGSFLEPFASGAVGVDGMVCAASAICAIAREESSFAPLALQLAIQWVGGEDLFRRVTAGWTLINDVGMLYPAEAARRLWQLTTQDQALVDEAGYALASLLANLVEGGNDAADILELLDRQLARFNKPGAEIRMVDVTLDTILGVLSATNGLSGELVILDLVREHPQHGPTVGRLWAGALRNRRGFRVRALEALWEGLFVSRNRQRDAEALGTALYLALSEDEYMSFTRDFQAMDVRKRQQDTARSESIAELLIGALERMHGMKPAEE